MASETDQKAAVSSSAARRPVLAGIGIAFGAATVLGIMSVIPSQFVLGYSNPAIGTASYVIQFTLVAAMAIGAVLISAWNQNTALSTAISLIAVHVVANGLTMAVGYFRIVNFDELGGVAFTLWSAVITLGSSFSIATIAGAAAGGWLLVALLERKQRTATTSA